jgi:predicted DNA-binding protein YlxM (UPF0122 family)
MGRPSKLTDKLWLEIERRHVVEGESINSLAAEFGINESSIRRKIKPNSAELPKGENPLKLLAQEKVRADAESRRIAEQIADLPYAKQHIVSELARKLTSVSDHLGSAAEHSAATSHRLAALANEQVQKVDDAEPEKSMEALQRVAVLTKLANAASEIGMNLLRANKEVVDGLNKPQKDVPKTLSHFYGE